MKRITKVTAVLTTALLASGLAACSGSSSATTPAATASIDSALSQGGSLTFWGWSPADEKRAKAFEAAYPKVTVQYVNAGSGTDEYTKLSNAVAAGKGGPDVAQMEYTAIPQFALSKTLVDLAPYGFGDLKSKFATASWSAVASGQSVWGVPEDSGPMALFYNKRIFDKFGITVPTTWDQFVTAAKKLHAADPTEYLTSDGGDGLFTSSMIWQAGGHPYTVDGTKVTLNLQDEGTKKWTAVWNQLVQGSLLSPTPSYTDDWYKQLGNGQIAALVSGAWMPGLLASSAPAGAGDWQAAPMPTYDGKAASANYGGSAAVVVKGTKNAALAAAFARWIETDPQSIKIAMDAGTFPATVADLKSDALLSAKSAYFGNQEVNRVLLAASDAVPSGWQYLPFQSYAQTIFADSVGQAYANHTDLNPALKKWQDALVSYGNHQGFTVTGK